MNNLNFNSEQHKAFFLKYVNLYSGDMQTMALFYLLGVSESTRTNIKQIYDFESHCIIPDCLTAGWLTSSTGALIRLAFDLFHSDPVIPSDDYPISNYSVSNTLGKLNEWLPYGIAAINLIYG